MRMRTTNERGMCHFGQPNIVDKTPFAGDQRRIFVTAQINF